MVVEIPTMTRLSWDTVVLGILIPTNAIMKKEKNAIFNIANVDDAIFEKVIASNNKNSDTYIDDTLVKRLPVNEINSIEDIINQYYLVQMQYAINCQIEEQKVNTLDIVAKKISLINRCFEILNNKQYSNEVKSSCIIEVLKMYPEKSPWMYEQEDAIDVEYIMLECVKEYVQAVKELNIVLKIIASQMKKLLAILEKEKAYYYNKYN